MLTQPKNKGEYYLTDAFQYMIDKGAKLKVIDVEGWYDAGKLDTLLETNRTMLEKGARAAAEARRGERDDPRSGLHRGRRDASNSTIGPNVSIGAGSGVEGSTLTRHDRRLRKPTIKGSHASQLADRRRGGDRGAEGRADGRRTTRRSAAAT